MPVRPGMACAVRAIADAIHESLIAAFRISERNRFQVITERPAASIIALDTFVVPDEVDGLPDVLDLGNAVGRWHDAVGRRLWRRASARGSITRMDVRLKPYSVHRHANP